MSPQAAELPQLSAATFITDGGLETDLIFHRGFELPEFAAFVLLDDERGRAALRSYFGEYIQIAREHGAGVVFDTPTWRASPDWGERLGLSREALVEVNERAVDFLAAIRATDGADVPFVVSGCIGPRGDGYRAEQTMSAEEAESYHSFQCEIFARCGADMVSALTLNYVAEAIGIVRAARAAGIPVVISFTVETDGRLPSGESLADAIEEVDDATDGYAAYFMVNCAHPTHFEDVLWGGDWVKRIKGLRANASMKSHAELDEAEELDEGDPDDLAARYRELRELLPNLNVVGGCCGTDARHVRAICAGHVAR